MFVFLQQNRAIFFAFLACVIGAVGIFVLAYLTFSSARPVAFHQINIASLPHIPPGHIEITDDASIVEPPATLPLYTVVQNPSVERIRSFWELPEEPTRILSEGKALFWQTERASVTLNLALATIHYTNNAPSYQNAPPFVSLEEATAFGEAYLKTLPFLDGVQLKHVSSAFIKIYATDEEPGGATSWDDADAVVLAYGRTINNLPVITAENSVGSLYTVLLDKRGAVLSFDASLFDVTALPLSPQATPVLISLAEVRQAIQAQAITFIALSDETALLDINSLQNKTIQITRIELGYLLGKEGGPMQPVYIIKGAFDYYGREVETTALYPAVSL